MVNIHKEVKVNGTILAKWRKALYKDVTHNSFFEGHQLEEIKSALRPFGVTIIMEDGDEWSGFLCGSRGSVKFDLGYDGGVVSNSILVYEWYDKSVHGLDKLEVNAYIS